MAVFVITCWLGFIATCLLGRPNDFQVPIKHGMRDCSYLNQDNAKDFHLSTDCTPEEKTR